MSRILIVFSSPSGSDHKDWYKLRKPNIGKDYVYVFGGLDYRLAINREMTWDFEKIKEKVSNLNMTCEGCNFSVLLHTLSDLDIESLKKELKDKLDISIARFSTASDVPIPYNKYIKKLCDEPTELNFNLLWDKIQKKSPEDMANKAHSIRSEVLAPFILLHFGLQMKESFFYGFSSEEKEFCKNSVELWSKNGNEAQLLSRFKDLPVLPDELEENVKTFIEGHRDKFNKIIEILKYLGEGKVNEARKSANEHESLLTAIEDLAETLEKIVAYVEFCERPSISK